MSNKKISFKNMNNSDKVKLINNSLVLDGISLKELSKKIDIQKKDIIKFMNEEGFFFDSTDGYFKKDKEESTSIDIKPSVETSKSSLPKTPEREDVQSIIDSINEKLNIKDIETTNILLPEIKTSEKVSVTKEDNSKDNTKTSQSMTLEIPRVSRTARRKKKKKKTLIKRMISYFKNSFSKIFLPGIRIGYIVTPNIFRESMQNSKFNTDIATSSLMQRALELYIKDGAWKDNISYLNVEYKKRYELMSKLIDEELGDMVTCNKPGGGLTFYLKIADERVTSRELFLRLSKKNVYITPGVLFFRNMSDGDRTFRIGFSQTNEEKIKKGLKLIREELETWHI